LRKLLGAYYSWAVVAFLIVLFASNFIDRIILGLLVAPIRADLHISDTQFSLLAGFSFATMYVTAGVFMGWLVDHGSRRLLIAGGCAVWSAMTALCGVASNFWSLFACRVGVGIGEATLSPSAYSLISDLFARNKLARALSFYASGAVVGHGVGLLVGGSTILALADVHIVLPYVGQPRPWQLVFLAIGVPGLLLAALTPLVIKEPVRRFTSTELSAQVTIKSTAAFIWRRRAVYLAVMFGVTASALFSYAASTWLPSVLIRVHHFNAGQAGIFLGLSSLILGLPGCLLSGWLADYFIARGRVDGHIIVSKIYVSGLAVCGILAPFAPWPWLSLTMIAGLGFFLFTWTGVPTALLQLMTPNRMRGQVSSIYLFLINIVGLGLGPTLVALGNDYIFARPDAVGRSLSLVGVVGLVSSLLLWEFAGRRIRAEAAEGMFQINAVVQPGLGKER
jgi:MFS family permease